MRKPQGSSFKICFDLKGQGEATVSGGARFWGFAANEKQKNLRL